VDKKKGEPKLPIQLETIVNPSVTIAIMRLSIGKVKDQFPACNRFIVMLTVLRHDTQDSTFQFMHMVRAEKQFLGDTLRGRCEVGANGLELICVHGSIKT
jgi:hypothetical protein